MVTEINARERRWIVLGGDGRHVTLGRHTNPTQGEIDAAEAALKASGQAGWLAVMQGRYYSRGAVDRLMVRPLACPGDAWDAAARAFETLRQTTLGPC